jgi:hypothetical protein
MRKAVPELTTEQLQFVQDALWEMIQEERKMDSSMRGHGYGRALTIAAKVIEHLLDNSSLKLKTNLNPKEQ